MVISKEYQTFKPKMAMAVLAITLLLASVASGKEIVGENIASRTTQLRGGTRSLSALAPEPLFSDSDRLADKTVRLPVTPGIAKGVDSEDLPCLVETICGQPDLSVLCGFITFNLDTWNETSGMNNFFLGEGQGTFLAPVDGAFEDFGTLLQHILEVELENPAILENVLLYHVIEIDESQNSTDLLMSLQDFECDAHPMMANGDRSHTVCFDESEKIQLGFGNRNMRNLPKITEGGIEACDGDIVMHFVDQLILPPLPLQELPTTPPSREAEPNEPLPPPRDECPVTRSQSCLGYSVGKSCDYGHLYQGCTWQELSCQTVESCTCTADGSWMCAVRSAQRCGSFDADLAWVDDDLPEGLPWGQACDPDAELPVPPSDEDESITSRLSAECPSSYSFGSCERFEPGLQCDYNYEYNGCTWETVECSPVMQCECGLFRNGNWACRSEARLSCPDRRTEGVPVGRCDPKVPLPSAPTTNSTMVTAEASSATVETAKLSLTSSETESDRNEEVVLSLMAGGMP